jgi:trimeric autotransporter adhesin
MKYRFLLMLLALAMVPAYAQVSVNGTGSGKAVAASADNEVAANGATLPVEARTAISAAVGQDDHSYEITSRAGAFAAENKPQQLSATFKAGRVQIRTGDADFGMALLSYGYGNALRAVPGAVPHASLNRMEYRRGSLTEWYVNGPAGLEQGFTLAQPPTRKRSGPLTIALALSGDLAAAPEQSGSELTLKDRTRTERLRYAGLVSYDATGKQLPTSMEIRGGQLRLKVEDAGAVYPLVVDPWVYAAELTASDGKAYNFFGNSVSVSVDGKTVAIGAFQSAENDNGEEGSVYVFVKPKTGWKNTSTFTAKLTNVNGGAGDCFGTSVAVSANAETIVAGAPGTTIGSNLQQGAVYVYVEPATGGWVTTDQPAAQLTAVNGNAGDWLGFSVAFRGSTVVAGAPNVTVGSNQFQGAAYVFVEPTGGWTSGTENAELFSQDGEALDQFGYAVDNSNNVIVVGADQATVSGKTQAGAAYVFVEPTGGWSGSLYESAKLTAESGLSEDLFGSSVVISSDSTTIGVGAEAANVEGDAGQGAAYVFVEPSGGWTGSLNETAELTASDGLQEDNFGASIAMNFTATTIVVGANLAPNGIKGPGAGKAYIYAKPKTGGWVTTSTYTQELKPSNGRVGDQIGFSVAVNSNTLVVGAMGTCIPTSCLDNKTHHSNVYQGSSYIWNLP